MKNNNQIKEKVPPWEKPIFIMIVTIVGGYMNGYTYITRHHILANMHTANMSKLGINIALGQWQGALSYFIPIVACILGAAFSELVKALLVIHKFKGDWRKLALILEAIALFFIGLIPTSFPDIIVTNLVSFFMGYQLCLFRECLGIAFNTTICTGNIRNVGQLLYSALDEKSKDSIRKLIIFTCLTFSFALGAIPGTLISIAISTKAVWVCSFILLTQAVWINIYECSMV
ncbi:YoaK family protein [Romboutsia sp. 1001216sp1]|uniref:YoaK family protein n=1 Tax=unclassified Romboutsia TaxID=2626894 RepID=UPI00189D165F|nr:MULTISPECIES: YoaK family protein [unclassified Romboutsia]MDB8791764.1 YoaK family protein [Romboutsia sp. 1001216sp1]MDB8801064.1 YoaK family protein [Romboutsia sp. 1001216sp1]MDB8812463.1 YoaK family protein [Romboutsia sp. 1001216sp1]